MEYELSVVVSQIIFVLLDLTICIKSVRNDGRSNAQKFFPKFAFSVALQQLFGALTQLSDPTINRLGGIFTYFAYFGALVFMTASSYYCYRYLRLVTMIEQKDSRLMKCLVASPVYIILVTCLVSPFTHWLYYVDETGAYQRGSLFILQLVCPYVYIAMSAFLAISQRKKADTSRVKKMLRFFFLFMIPSIIGVIIQMFIVRGGYSAIGVSVGLLLLYLEIYIEDLNEYKRLKSVEPLTVKLQQANEEQEKRLNEISELNQKLENRMSVIQSLTRVYFVSFFANIEEDSFSEISNTDFVRKYVGTNGTASQALEVFCEKMVVPQFTDQLREFVDLSTLDERMQNKQFITCDYLGNVAGWCQLYFIEGDRDENRKLKTVYLVARTIHDEKEREFAQNRELDNARIAAEAASAAKTVFLNNMSHDIRTPLNAILGFSKLMAKEKDDPKAVDSYLKKIKTSGEYLLSIINNVLDMARIESGKVTVENVLVDLFAEEETTHAYVRELVEASQHNFSIGNTIRHRYVMLDVAKHREILMNLISNAIKYTPENGSVHLQMDELPCDRPGYGTYKMTVSDTGIGMSQEYLEHIFDSFSRERNTTDSKIIGTGLGMSIVKRLVDLLGGTIEVESEKGKGTRFIVTYDFELADDPEEQPNRKDTDTEDIVIISGKRVLLAEDNELNTEITVSILEDEGLSVEHAENGKVCVDMLSNAPEGYYDLILMDIQMPVMNGYEATKAIRELPYGKHIPIIALSANAFAEDKAASIAAGMDSHIAKPINTVELMNELYKLL